MGNAAIPRTATIEQQFTGSYEGETLCVTLYTGHASDGYQSDFQRRPARWILRERLNAGGDRQYRQCARYGGRRMAQGLTDYTEFVAHLLSAGVVIGVDKGSGGR